MKRFINKLTATLATVVVLTPAITLRAEEFPILEQLDHTILFSNEAVDWRNRRIEELEAALDKESNLRNRYAIYCALYDEYFAYQFDMAMDILGERHELAERLGDNALMADVDIERARLFATSGMFFEADAILKTGIDTLSLSREQLINYYNVQQRFNNDFYHYTSDADIRSRAEVKTQYYRNQILRITTPDEPIYNDILLSQLCHQKRWTEAEQLNLKMLEAHSPNEHRYAMCAYDRARILEALERREEMIEWFARSAMADINTATKDNAALCSLAQVLLEFGDVDRAFRYINYSLNDALFYNAKLRPWQISAVILQIEQAYHAKQIAQHKELSQQQKHARNLSIVISLLAMALLLICIYMATLLSRSRRAERKIREMNEDIGVKNAELHILNERMRVINSDLSEANAVKEEYIALFLSICSDYIEKLSAIQRNVRKRLSTGQTKELQEEIANQNIVEEEVNNFYEMFDNVFLHLYPTFVEEFNALLKADSQLTIKRGEQLNTELRIFALIRLGITDSSRIASLLRYSVNTIYNYRARIKNAAACDRDSFEERVKTIGKPSDA